MALNLGYVSPVTVWSCWGHLRGERGKERGEGGGRSDPPRLGGGELKSLVETAGTLPSHVSQSHESLQG